MAKNQVAYIDNLPSELLGLTFKFLHDDLRSSRSEKGFEQGLNIQEENFNLSNMGENHVSEFLSGQKSIVLSASLATLLPYCVADVSSKWEAILSFSAHFWTRIVLPVSLTTSLKKIGEYLSWSKDLPIDVFILSKQEEGHNKLREREIVTCFISFLRPYMDRCRSLHLAVKFNSSFPSLSKIVPSRLPLLRALDIQCQSDDGIHLEEVEEEDDVDNDKQEEYYPAFAS